MLSWVSATHPGVRVRQERRHQVETLLSLAEHLEGRDRLLVEQVLRHGTAIVELCRLTGRSRKTVERRLQRLLRRMQSPLFGCLVVRGEEFPAELRRVGQEVVFGCRSLRGAAARLGMSLHEVREQMAVLRWMVSAGAGAAWEARAAGPLGPGLAAGAEAEGDERERGGEARGWERFFEAEGERERGGDDER